MLELGMAIEIKKFGIEYLDEAANLEKKYMLPPLTFAFTKEELRRVFNNFLMWGAFDDKKLVGKVGYIKEKSGDYELDGMVISPEYRGQHLGKGLMETSLKEIKNIVGQNKIFLFVNPRNSPALILYLKSGFEIEDWIPNKFGDGENRLRMVFKR